MSSLADVDGELTALEDWIRAELGETAQFKGSRYLREYARILGPQLASMSFVVELGVAEGASLLAWSRLCPKARCLGIDIEPALRLASVIERLGLQGRVSTLFADHGDVAKIRSALDAPVDLIVDDGSHRLEPARRCFFGLFETLRPGGWYCIEDWGAGYWHDYGGPHGGIHRLLYEILDLIAAKDRAKPEAGPYRIPVPSFPSIGDFRVSTKEPIAFVQRRS